MMLTSPWLSLLFLVSGVATAHLMARGSGNFMRSRSARLLIPLAFGMLVIVPPQSYPEVVEKVGYSGSFAEFYRLYITGYHGFCREDCRSPDLAHRSAGRGAPRLLLQPLVENALRHGLPDGRGILRVEVERYGTRLRYNVSDDGVGLGEQAVKPTPSSSSTMNRRRAPR